MSAAESPLAKSGEPVSWNFKLLAHERSRRLRRHGRRHVGADRQGRAAHHLAGARERAEEFHRRRRVRSAQAESGGADRTAAGLYALELAGAVRRHHGGGLSDAEDGPAAGRAGAVRRVGAGEAALDLVLRLLGPTLARRASVLVLRRRIRAHGGGRARFHAQPSATTTSSTAASTCAIRRSRWKSGAGGCRARVPATTRRCRRAMRSTRAIARTTPMSTRSGRTGFISATSTAACS